MKRRVWMNMSQIVINQSFQQVEQNYNDGHYTKVLEIIDDIIVQTKQQDECMLVAKLYDMKIDCYKFISLPEQAHQTLTEFHEFIEHFGTLESTIWFHLTAISLWENGSVAVDDIIERHIVKLSSYVFQTDDANLKRRIYGTIATHAMNLQQFEKAIDYLELAFLYAQITAELDPSRKMLEYSTIIDLVYLNTMIGRHEIANLVNDTIYPYKDEFSGYQKGLVLQNFGYLLMQKGEYEAAIEEFEQLVEHTTHYHDTSLRAIAYQYICDCMEKINHPSLITMLKNQIQTLNDLNDEGQAALALATEAKIQHNSYLKKSAVDSLTNVYTRAYFEEHATPLLTNKQPHEMYALGIIDLDYFKQINDIYGHLVGDAALSQVGSYLKSVMLKQNALACRYGGDEFFILFSGHSIEELQAKAKQLFDELATQCIDVTKDHMIDLSFSIGFVALNTFTSMQDAIVQADSALYYVKKNGRKDYVFYHEVTI